MSGPEDVRGEHEGQVVCRHLVLVLQLGGVVQQVQQQLEQRAVGRRQQQEEQLQRLDLALLVGNRRLVAVLVEQRHVWKRNGAPETPEAAGAGPVKPESVPAIFR